MSDNRENGVYMASLKGSEQIGLEFAKRMGAENIAELRATPYEKWLIDPLSQMGGFWPTADGYVIDGDQYKLYSEGKYNDVNVIIGTNSDEGSVFVRAMDPKQYAESVRSGFGPLAASVALELFPGHDSLEVYHSLWDSSRETVFAWPSYTWARLQSETGKSKVFVYYFDQLRRPVSLYPGGPAPKGATHSSGTCVMYSDTLKQNPDAKVTDEETSLFDIMIKYWTNLARSEAIQMTGTCPFGPCTGKGWRQLCI